MKTQLQYIKEIITNHTAVQYAEMMLEKEKKNCTIHIFNASTRKVIQKNMNYYEYMKQTWHWEDNPPIEECIEASRISKLNEYAEAVQMYSGWIKNGKLFVLNKREAFVSFIYKIDKESLMRDSKIKSVIVRTNYNPREVDCIEESLNPRYFSEMISDEHYDISKNEKELNALCDKLCATAKLNTLN